MKSVALLFWLVTANGGEQLQMPIHHYDDVPSCELAAQGLEAKHAGKASRHNCHQIQPEVTEVDVNGNPIEPESRLVSPVRRQAIAGTLSVK